MISAFFVAVSLLLVGPSVALPGWSEPRPIAAPGAGPTAVAVDGHGDAAVAWATTPAPQLTFGTTVHVAVRLASGKVIAHAVWSSGKAQALHVLVAMGHGEVTVAWVCSTRNERLEGATLRAAYGPLAGRWAPARVIGHWHDFAPPANRYPRLAVAPAGEVLLAFDDNSPAINGPAVAWRTPGHRFGAPQLLIHSAKTPLEVPHELGPIPAFDARGSAYVWGNCDGIVVTAPVHSHRFGSPRVVAPAPVLGFALSLDGAGQGLAGWENGVCTTDQATGNTPGPVFASVLQAGVFGQPLAVSAATQTVSSNAVAVPNGVDTVSWTLTQGEVSGGMFLLTETAFTVPIGTGGTPGPIQQDPGALFPVAATGSGDQVLAGATTGVQGVQGPLLRGVIGEVTIRPAGGAANQPAPSRYGLLATATPVGRAVALLWNSNPTGSGPVLELSVWRP